MCGTGTSMHHCQPLQFTTAIAAIHVTMPNTHTLHIPKLHMSLKRCATSSIDSAFWSLMFTLTEHANSGRSTADVVMEAQTRSLQRGDQEN